jgi:predicted amidophosphoribosyltransferase
MSSWTWFQMSRLLSPPCPGCGGIQHPCQRCQREFSCFRARIDGRVHTKAFPILAGARYDSAARRLVVAWKERGSNTPAAIFVPQIHHLLTQLVSDSDADISEVSLVSVPSRLRTRLVRGEDVVGSLAAAVCSRYKTVGHVTLRKSRGELRRVSGKDQVGLSAGARIANAQESYQSGRRIQRASHAVLIDDICTTGATLSACRSVLSSAGWTILGAVVLCATKVEPLPQIDA